MATWFPTSTLYRKFKTTEDAVEWVLLLLCVRKVPASNPAPEVFILTDFFSLSRQIPRGYLQWPPHFTYFQFIMH